MNKKIGDIKDGPVGDHRFFFLCPGCGYAHCFTAKDGEYNNNPVEPTIKKDIVIPGHIALFRCRSTINAGMITFFNDCSHELAGFTFELPSINNKKLIR